MNILVLTNIEHESFVYKATRQYANEHLIIVLFDRDDADRFFNGFSYDIGISFMYLHKVPVEQIDKHPWFNIHPAPLPEYRGRDLCYHAIMDGAKEFGATIHYMSEEFDAGDIIEVRKFGIDDWMMAEDVSGLALMASERLFCDYLPKILETRVFPRIPNVGGTYYKKGKIIEEIPVRPNDPFGQFVRAVSFPSKGFHPRIDIGGVKYKIVREE